MELRSGSADRKVQAIALMMSPGGHTPGKGYRMETISEKLQAILAKAAELHDTDILWHTPNETLYEAVNFYVCAQAATIGELKALVDQQAQAMRRADVALQEQAAEIDRLKAASERSCAELLLLRDMEHERCRVARQEADRLKAALEQAKDVRDDILINADQIGELLFGDYAEEDPTGNGNERYWPKDHGTPDHIATVHLGYGTAKEVARLINEMLDSDWVDTTGDRQIHSSVVVTRDEDDDEEDTDRFDEEELEI